MIFKSKYPTLRWFLPLLLLMGTISCNRSKEEKQVALYETYCASCHIAPAIDALPKTLWATKVLPEMAARMGIRDMANDPYKGLPMDEHAAILKTGIYPASPILDVKDWELLKAYIIAMAPETMPKDTVQKNSKIISLFTPIPIALDSTDGSSITYLNYDGERNRILTGTMRGELFQYDIATKKTSPIGRSGNPITDYIQKKTNTYLTTIGFLLPSEIPSGTMTIKSDGTINSFPEKLHRPVHTLIQDLDNDGTDEIVVSEFGDLNGSLSLWTKAENGNYFKTILLDQPGVIRTVAKDMDKDGKNDIVAITSQGDESITILFQEDSLRFRAEKVIRFPPIYGSSWFELVDYDNDGDDDIVTVHGDNADETYIQKSYHGMRIHLNDGENSFHEAYFYPMNGCTRVIARDFDQDGDTDFALLSTFPDYENRPDESFLYLENTDTENFNFESYVLEDPGQGRWFLMDSGDVDSDGDEDLILSSLIYAYSPIPDDLKKRWYEENTDIVVLENQLN